MNNIGGTDVNLGEDVRTLPTRATPGTELDTNTKATNGRSYNLLIGPVPHIVLRK